MISHQKASMAGVNKNMADTEKKIRKRKAEELQRKEQSQLLGTSDFVTC